MVIVRAYSLRLSMLRETVEFCGYVRCLTLEETSRAKGTGLKIGTWTASGTIPVEETSSATQKDGEALEGAREG